MMAWVALMCMGCTGDDYLGNPEDISKTKAICFNGGTGKMTRVLQEGRDAADLLNDQFVVYGFKTTGGNKQTVYDYYTVNYVDNSALTTQSNSAGWEYVGGTPNMLTSLSSGVRQEIKYWDFAASQYDFVAFSLGGVSQVSHTVADNNVTSGVRFSRINNESLNTNAYTVYGPIDNVANVFIADRVIAQKGVETKDYVQYPFPSAIKFAFHPLGAKVRIGLYETIPGYSVKDVKFYQEPRSASSITTPYLYAGSQTIPSGTGKVTISFPVTESSQTNYNKAVATYEGNKAQNFSLRSFTPNAPKEHDETDGDIFLGRTSNTASMSSDVMVVPAPANELTLKIDFTLVSIDYNETIEMKGVVATVPADFTNWQAGYAYTYLFKISDAVSDASGQLLYPVTFDALETMDDEGVQQTITTIDVPSITTYAKGAVSDDYYVGDNIYVSVADNTKGTLSLNSDNSKLYTVSLGSGSGLSDSDVTEINIKDGMAGITLNEVNEVTPGFMSFVTSISAEDSPTGVKIDGNFAKFTAGSDIYVFKYIAEDDTEHYKVIRVGNARRPLILPDIPEEDI